MQSSHVLDGLCQTGVKVGFDLHVRQPPTEFQMIYLILQGESPLESAGCAVVNRCFTKLLHDMSVAFLISLMYFYVSLTCSSVIMFESNTLSNNSSPLCYRRFTVAFH